MKSILQGKRLRQRGPQPTLSDSEVLTIESIGEFLGFDQDKIDITLDIFIFYFCSSRGLVFYLLSAYAVLMQCVSNDCLERFRIIHPYD